MKEIIYRDYCPNKLLLKINIDTSSLPPESEQKALNDIRDLLLSGRLSNIIKDIENKQQDDV